MESWNQREGGCRGETASGNAGPHSSASSSPSDDSRRRSTKNTNLVAHFPCSIARASRSGRSGEPLHVAADRHESELHL